LRDLFALKVYVRVARLGSFSAAARECGLSQPQASRIVSDLEAELGVRLLSRTTRAVATTDAGGEFLTRIEPILSALDEAENGVREGEFRGQLRMSMPASFGIRAVIPHLAAFTASHRELCIHLHLEDQGQDLVRNAVDLAIRLGQLPDSGATSRKIATMERVVVAAPDYLSRYGAPRQPPELGQHRIVGESATHAPTAWLFSRDGREVKLDLDPHFVTNDNRGAVAAAAAGLGITSTSEWACRHELQDGQLLRLLPEWALPGIAVHAYFPMGNATRAAARAIVDHLVAAFQQDGRP
jgi:DNA-binding transcriptional LysR family regulator